MRTQSRTDIRYRTYGEGGPKLVLLHGLTATRRYVVMGSRALERADHRVVMYDARAHGSSEGGDDYSYTRLSKDLLAVLDDRGIERAVLAGASMGAHTLTAFALAHPERVRALALIGATVRGAPEIATEGRTAALAAQIDAAWEAGDVDETNRLEAWYWLDGPGGDEGRVEGEARELFLDMNDGALRARSADLASIGAGNGDWVAVATRTGRIVVRAEVDESMRPRQLALPHGFGMSVPDGQGGRVVNGPRINLITDAADRDPIAGTPHHKDVPVLLEPATAAERELAERDSRRVREVAAATRG